MAVKPFQSTLIPYQDEIAELRSRRPSVAYARIAEILREKYGLLIQRAARHDHCWGKNCDRSIRACRTAIDNAAAGLGHVTWHQLRHVHSSVLHDPGVPVKIVQRQLGHAAVETTLNIYTHVVGETHRKAIEGLERVLFPNVPNFDGSRNTGGFVN